MLMTGVLEPDLKSLESGLIVLNYNSCVPYCRKFFHGSNCFEAER